MADDDAVQLKLVVVGDGAIGKSCFLIAYEKDEFPTDYIPTVFENVTLDKIMFLHGNASLISLDLWDTAGQEEFDRLRHLAYRESDIYLVCFSVVEETSFFNLQSRWLPEVQHHKSPEALIGLIGLKCDLRDDETVLNKLKESGKSPVSPETIEDYRKSIGAAFYVETSSLKKINIEKAFETAVTQFLNPPDPGNSGKKNTSNECSCVII
eukprot:UN10686